MRLPRPHIPLDVRCRIAARQLGLHQPDPRDNRGKWGELLRCMLDMLGQELGCDASRLHLDHDPALGARERIVDENGDHVDYVPRANDPEHLVYREKGEHEIKTNVRGIGAQHPDRVLIKKERRRLKPKAKRKGRWPQGRKLKSRSAWPKGRKIRNG